MNRWLWIASIAVVMSSTTGCLRHNTRCNGGCNSCNVGGGGLLGKLTNKHCGSCRTGCVPGPIGWQQGGLNYSSHLCPHGGTAGHCAACGVGGGGVGQGAILGGMAQRPAGMPGGMHAGMQQPINPGPPTGTVAYPYYTHRGPRDFLLDNPPSIGR